MWGAVRIYKQLLQNQSLRFAVVSGGSAINRHIFALFGYGWKICGNFYDELLRQHPNDKICALLADATSNESHSVSCLRTSDYRQRQCLSMNNKSEDGIRFLCALFIMTFACGARSSDIVFRFTKRKYAKHRKAGEFFEYFYSSVFEEGFLFFFLPDSLRSSVCFFHGELAI